MGASHSTSHQYVLETSRGNLKGIEQRDDATGKAVYHRYAKIPFALPPTGSLRWRRPQPLPKGFNFSSSSDSDDPGDYTKFGPVCPQPEYNTGAAKIENPEAAPEVENVQDEDCLYLNIWVPAGNPPSSKGWPVQFHIHGGWLQVGDANQGNDSDPIDIFRHTGDHGKRIIVAPTYRLNLFGFLGGSQFEGIEGEEKAPGNFGFWDQRMALEWVYENIPLFGGDAKSISVGGLSAGAHSAFLQLYYDNMLPIDQRIISRIYLWSNALAIQPNPTTGQVLTEQFDELCSVNHISSDLSSKEKLSKLRQVPFADLVKSISKLKQHTFRGSTDDSFIPSNFLTSLKDGSFASSLASSPLRPKIMLGEVRDEALLYKLINPPSTYTDLERQLGNYYPAVVVQRLLSLNHLYDIPNPDATGPDAAERFATVFSLMTADLQVHASERGLVHCLRSGSNGKRNLGADQVLRYRIHWRAKGLDKWLKPEVGVCHAADGPIWWANGWRAGYNGDDKEKANLFLKDFSRFLNGDDGVEREWYGGDDNCDDLTKVKLLDEDGKMHCGVQDELWDRNLEVWKNVVDAQLNK